MNYAFEIISLCLQRIMNYFVPLQAIMEYTLNIKGQLLDLQTPRVMGILNATPDSFFADSRKQTEQEIASRANEIVSQGATFIDVGAYSTRPGAAEVSEQEEMERMRMARFS